MRQEEKTFHTHTHIKEDFYIKKHILKYKRVRAYEQINHRKKNVYRKYVRKKRYFENTRKREISYTNT